MILQKKLYLYKMSEHKPVFHNANAENMIPQTEYKQTSTTILE